MYVFSDHRVQIRLVAAATIRERRLFRSALAQVRLLFESGVYSRGASIRSYTVVPFLFCTCPALFCPCLVACGLHADRETETVGGRVNGGGRLACIEKKGGGRLPGTWALTLTRPKTGGGRLPGSGRLPGILRYMKTARIV